MDWINLTTAIGASGAIAGLFSWLSARRTNTAQAKQTDAQTDVTSATYAAEIIKQADDRVLQYKTDADNARTERDEARTEYHAERDKKREWREKYWDTTKRVHELEMSIKDLEYDKCLVSPCNRRQPPRREPEATMNINQ